MKKSVFLIGLFLSMMPLLSSFGDRKKEISKALCHWCRASANPPLIYCPNCSYLLPKIVKEISYPEGKVQEYHYSKDGSIEKMVFQDRHLLTITFSLEKGKVSEEKWMSSYFKKLIKYSYRSSGQLLKAEGKGTSKTTKYYFYSRGALTRTVVVGESSSHLWECSYDPLSGQRKTEINRVILLDSEGNFDFSKTTRWTYEIQKGRILKGSFEELSQRKNRQPSLLKGWRDYTYSPKGKLEKITTYLGKDKIREILFQ